MDDRIDRLESTVEQLSSALRQVESQLTELQRVVGGGAQGPGVSVPPAVQPATPPAGASPFAPPPVSPETAQQLFSQLQVPWARLVSLVGRTFLVLGGAFLLRALTDLGTLPVQAGLAAGLLYAILWLVVAGLAGGAGKLLAPTFHAASAVMIAYPLLWEAATRFKVVSGTQAAVALGVVTCFALAISWWRRLRVGAWLVVLAAIATSFALQVRTATIEPHVVVLIVTGVAALWMAYTRGWMEFHWWPALGVDLAVLNLVVLASRRGGPPEAYATLSLTVAPILALSLLFAYAGSFAVRTLLRKRDVSAFEVLQTIAAVIVGLGGAARIVQVVGAGESLVGGVALVLAVASYAVAFSLTELRWQHRRNFMFFAWQALIFTIVGSRLLVAGLPIDLLWCALAIGTAALGTRYRRLTLHYQSAVYVAVVASSSGLVALFLESFLAPAAESWRAPDASSLAALAATFACFVIQAMAVEDPRRLLSSRLPRLIVAIPAALGAGGLTVMGILAALGARPPEADPAVVASVRSITLAVFAVLLALASRRRRLAELKWLLLAVLISGGVKLLLEDLPIGRPTTLFIAFASYGLALIISPWILRFRRSGARVPQPPEEHSSPSAVGSGPGSG